MLTKNENDILNTQTIWVCKFCGYEDFTLMDTNLMMIRDEIEQPYYYHYGDYEKGCRQRIPYNEIFKYAKKQKKGD